MNADKPLSPFEEFKILSELIEEVQKILNFNEVDQGKVYQLLLKHDMNPKKVIAQIKGNLTFYRKNFKANYV